MLALVIAVCGTLPPVAPPLRSSCPRVEGFVQAMLEWDPDGAGPRNPQLVLGGLFTLSNSITPGNIACWDTVTGEWSLLGTGMNGVVESLEVLSNGWLAAGGSFTTAGGQTCSGVAMWNGAAWLPIGAGLQGTVNALETMPNGDLVAGGTINHPGGNNLVRWNGASWLPIGGGTNATVRCVRAIGNAILIGGNFSTAGGVPARVAKWDGAAWTSVGGSQLGNCVVLGLEELPSGEVFAAGNMQFAAVGTPEPVMKWDGTTWSTLPGAGGSTATGIRFVNGGLYVGVRPNSNTTVVRRWSAGVWQTMGGSFDKAVSSCFVWSILMASNGRLYAAGIFDTVAGIPLEGVAEWAGDWGAPQATQCPLSWELDQGFTTSFAVDGKVKRMETMPGGDLLLMGTFAQAGFPPINSPRLVRWNATTGWQAMPNAPAALSNLLFALHVTPTGDIVMGGHSLLARWNGVNWQNVNIAPRTLNWCTGIASLPNGNLVVSGAFVGNPLVAPPISSEQLLVITPSGAVAVGAPFSGSSVSSVVACMPNGDVVFGHDGVSAWDGSSWTTIAGSGASISCLHVLANGDLIAGGAFTSIGGVAANGIARWDGVAWHAFGSGVSGCVSEVAEIANGEIVAVGNFAMAGGVNVNNIARWDGAHWFPIGGGLSDKATCVAVLPSGDLAVGGFFTGVDCEPVPYLAMLRDRCAAGVISRGEGCPSSGGSNLIEALTLPLVNTMFRVEGTGLPQSALVLTLTSVNTLLPPLPLSLVFPQALPGCDLHVGPDILGVVLPSGGIGQHQFFLPNSPPLVGVTFHHQWLPIETDITGAWIAVTVTNALQVTVGS